MKKLLVVLSLGIVFLLTGCGDAESKIEVSVKKTSNSKTVNVKSLVDDIVIEDVIVNKGRCRSKESNGDLFYISQTLLVKDSTVKYNFSKSCDIERVLVQTDLGEWTYYPKTNKLVGK